MAKKTEATPMLSPIRFTVLGRPQPQGSTRAFMVKGKPRITCDNKEMAPWRQTVGWAALEAASAAGWPQGGHRERGMAVIARLYFIRPTSAKKRVTPHVKPDSDKLARAVLDSLTGIAYADDAQVVCLHVEKHYGPIEKAEIEVGMCA